jgi:putative membrane protein
VQRLVVTWLFNVVALFVATWLLKGVSYGDRWWSLLLAAVVFTLANRFLRPLVTVLALPAIILTLGIALFFVNLLMLYVTDWVVPDFEIETFWWGVLATLIVAATNGVLSLVFGRPERRGRERRR